MVLPPRVTIEPNQKMQHHEVEHSCLRLTSSVHPDSLGLSQRWGARQREQRQGRLPSTSRDDFLRECVSSMSTLW